MVAKECLVEVRCHATFYYKQLLQKKMYYIGIYFAKTASAANYKARHHGALITAKVFVGVEHVVKDFKGGKFTFQDLQKVMLIDCIT